MRPFAGFPEKKCCGRQAWIEDLRSRETAIAVVCEYGLAGSAGVLWDRMVIAGRCYELQSSFWAARSRSGYNMHRQGPSASAQCPAINHSECSPLIRQFPLDSDVTLVRAITGMQRPLCSVRLKRPSPVLAFPSTASFWRRPSRRSL